MKNNVKEAVLTGETRSEGRNPAARGEGGGGGGGGRGVGSGRRFDKGGDSARDQTPGVDAVSRANQAWAILEDCKLLQ